MTTQELQEWVLDNILVNVPGNISAAKVIQLATNIAETVKSELVDNVAGFRGVLTISSPAPVDDGIYFPTETGIYPNAGNLEKLVTDAYILFIRESAIWSKYIVNVPQPKSAYESYVETTTDNPVLTESEWIESLHGIDGEDGEVNNLTDVIKEGNHAAIESDAVAKKLRAVRTINMFDLDREFIPEFPSAGFKTIIVDEIEPAENYIVSGLYPAYASWIDGSDNFMGWNWVAYPITAPAGAAKFAMRVANTDDLAAFQFEKGNVATEYQPYAYPEHFDQIYLKTDFNAKNKASISRNSNIDHCVTASPRTGVNEGSIGIGSGLIPETSELVKSYGVFQSYCTDGTYNPAQSNRGVNLNFFLAPAVRKKYLAIQTIISSNDPGLASRLNVIGYWGAAVPASIVITPIVSGTTNVLKLTAFFTPNNANLGAQIVAAVVDPPGDGVSTLSYWYKMSGFSWYEYNDDEIKEVSVDTLIQKLYGSEIATAESRYQSTLLETISPAIRMDKKRRQKTWLMLGTSIDTTMTGSANSWSERLGWIYNCRVINNAMGGSRISMEPTPNVGFDYVNTTTILPNDRTITMTSAERETWMQAVNRHPAVRYNTAEINNSYDISVLPHLSSVDVVIIGTFGANDPPTMPLTAMNATEVTYANGSVRYRPNAGAIMAAVSAADMFDRSTLFGAYNFLIRAIRRQYPKAKIILTGMNNFAWGQYLVHDIIEIVADLWCIPFLNMAKLMGQSEMVVSESGETARALIGETFDVHPWTPASRQWMAEMMAGLVDPYLKEHSFAS